jgi:geranylgeranyl diphosphate synthase type II
VADAAEDKRMIQQTWRFDGLDRGEDLDALRQDIEERMTQLLADGDKADLLTHAMRAGTLSAGKRMRPLLLMLVARDLGCDSPALVDVACAVEMVHAASLILDDMPCMDDAQLRRGKPAIHVAYGEDIAILASVALLSRAFCVLSGADDIPSAVRTRLVCALGETVGTSGLVRGQFLDLHGDARSAADIAVTNELKTGVLLGAAVDMAAIVAEADERSARSLRAFALAAGQAFQIRDDFQDDVANDSAVTGKDTGKDAGKSTFVNTLGKDEARRRLLAHLVEAERHLDAAVGTRQGTRTFVRSLFGQAVAAPRAGEQANDAARAARVAADGSAAARA